MLIQALVFSVVFILVSVPAMGQTTPNQQRNRVEDYIIRGKVITQNQRDGEQRIEVRLERSSTQVILTTFTDGSGNFDFRNLGPGSYFISVNLDGYEPVRQSVDLFNAFGNNGITIFLNKPAVVFRDRPAAIDAADPDIVDVSQMKENFPKKALQSFEKAVDEKKKGRFESALKLLQEAVKLAPNFFHAHNNLGIVYHALKRYTDAEQEFKRSRQLNAKSERPLVNLGSLYIDQAHLQKNGGEETGKLLDQALDALEEAVKLNPRSSIGHLLLGQANYRSGFYEEAEVAFKRAQYLDPELGVARLMLANVYVRLQKWDQVLEHLDAYLKENPKAADYASVEEMRGRVARSLQATHEREAAQ